jgi:hypothetical protein
MLNRIIAYTFFILGIGTVTFFRHYVGSLIPYPWVFFLLGITMLLSGYLFLRYAPSPKDTAARNRLSQLIADLRANGEQIRVDFNTCSIRGHDYRQALSARGTDSLLIDLTAPDTLTRLLDHLDNAGNNGMQEVRQSVIVFQHTDTRTGAVEKFVSPILAKDDKTLSFYLDCQQQTTLYVDRTNRNLYYFDLAFLNA